MNAASRAALLVLFCAALQPWASAATVEATPAAAAADATAAAAAAPGAAPVERTAYDGRSDDLLTAGLGLAGLRAAAPPAFRDALRPTAAELRRRAIYFNYRGLIDLSEAGGAGRDFGPRPGERIAGVEYRTRIDGQHDVLLQVPAGFGQRAPACLVAVASSGSRGIWGALPTAGEWGLRAGCAVVHTDKGTGIDAVSVERTRAARAAAPFFVHTRHAHSGEDLELRWGEDLIEATAQAFRWLNDERVGSVKPMLTPENTLVIAAGISNGGAAVLRALELDTGPAAERWFDGAVVLEPNVTLTVAHSLFEQATLAALLLPCAVLAEPDPAAPLQALYASGAPREALVAWCAELATHGDVRGEMPAAQAADARARLLRAGFNEAALSLAALGTQTRFFAAVAVTYASAYLQTPAEAMPCGFAFAAADASGQPRALSDLELASWPADSNGIPPTAGVELVRAQQGVYRAAGAVSPQSLRCLRALLHGTPAADGATAARLTERLRSLRLQARPGDRPVMLMHGRADSIIPVAGSSQAYYSAVLRGSGGRAGATFRYYELQHAQHIDALLPAVPGMAQRFVPTQPWLLAMMDRMYGHLGSGEALPEAQVLRARAGEEFKGFPQRVAPADEIRATATGAIIPE